MRPPMPPPGLMGMPGMMPPMGMPGMGMPPMGMPLGPMGFPGMPQGAVPSQAVGGHPGQQPDLNVERKWEEHTSPDGVKYYFDSVTKESTWHKPADFVPKEPDEP